MVNTWPFEDRFATMPVISVVSVVPVQQPVSEEELHTSFERAISDRLFLVNRQLKLKSGPLADSRLRLMTEPLGSGQPVAVTDGLVFPAPVQRQSSRKFLPALPGIAWQRGLIFANLAFVLILIGFDLMGLLMLYVH
jgi:hypothetical protein